MRKNNLFILKIWIPVILAFVLLLILLIHADAIVYAAAAASVPFIFILRKVLWSGMNKDISKALQSETSEALIHTLTKPLKKQTNEKIKQAFLAYHTALPYVLYGEYEKAEKTMSEVDWEGVEPLYRTVDLNIKSLIHYFTGEIHSGISNARKAAASSTPSKLFPGVNKSNEFQEMFVEIGQVLYGFQSEKIIHSLEMKFTKLPLLTQLILAWTLMNVYQQEKETAKYEKMKTFCETHAPHCKSLKPLYNEGQD
ncbi:MAG TPA: hypothetical protein VFK44_14205 [Bacillales bacterium]|nr:hypothetical protein [Bacillales bacterium]